MPVPRAREVYKLVDALSTLLDVTGAPADIEGTLAALQRLCGPRKTLRVEKQLYLDAVSYLVAWQAKEARIRERLGETY